MSVLTDQRLVRLSEPEAGTGEPQAPRALTDVIGTIAAELEELAVCGEGLQDLAARVMLADGTHDLVADLQVVDLLVQRLNALSNFARRLAPSVPGDWQVDIAAAAHAVTLTGVRNRLEGRTLGPAADGDGAGECDFF